MILALRLQILDAVHITANKNSIVGDKSAITPGGLRLGTCAMTTRGFTEADFETTADYIHMALRQALVLQEASGPKLSSFLESVKTSDDVAQLGCKIQSWAEGFPFPS